MTSHPYRARCSPLVLVACSWRARAQGLADAKGALFFEVTRFLHAKQPAAFILENVANIADVDDGNAMRTILSELRMAGPGYVVLHRTLNSRPLVAQVGSLFNDHDNMGPSAYLAYRSI